MNNTAICHTRLWRIYLNLKRGGHGPSLEKDLHSFIAACPNCQTHQWQRPRQEREYAQLVTDQWIQPFQRWGLDLIGLLRLLIMPLDGQLQMPRQKRQKKL